jgi:hypothetical protein
MMNSRSLCLAPFCWLTICLPAVNAFSAPRELLVDNSQLTMYTAWGEEKTRPDDTPPSGPATTPRISAARREYEPIQIVIYAKVSLSNVSLDCGEPVVGSATLPAPEIRVVDTVNVTQITYANFSPDPNQWLGEVPDPLPAYEVRDITAERNQAYWLTFCVPEDATADVYTAQVEVSSDQTGPISASVEIEVWDFVLPVETHLATAFDAGHFAVRYDHDPGDDDPAKSVYDYHAITTTEDKDLLVKTYYDDYARHRMEPYDFGYGHGISALYDATNEVFVYDFSDFDARLEPYLDDLELPRFMIHHGHDMRRFGVNFLGGGSATYDQSVPEQLADYDQTVGEYWRGVTDHLTEKGWLEKAYIMLDEPHLEDYDYVRHFTSVVFTEATSEFKIGPAIWIHGPDNLDKGLEGSINLWIPLNDERWSNAEYPYLDERQALGEEIWWYFITTDHFLIDVPGIAHRAMMWKAWKFRVSGLLTWAGLLWDTHAWEGDWNPQNANDYDNPWLKPASPWGNGVVDFYYPPDPSGPASSPTFELVPSLRWELFREGMEDYEYFVLLQEAIDSASGLGVDVSSSEQVLEDAMDVIISKTQIGYDPAPYRSAREAVAAEILHLREIMPNGVGNWEEFR